MQKKLYGACTVKKSSTLPENHILWELLSFWLEVGVQQLVIFHSSDCVINRIVCIYQTNRGFTASLCSSFAVLHGGQSLLGFLSAKYDDFMCLQIVRLDRHIYLKNNLLQ